MKSGLGSSLSIKGSLKSDADFYFDGEFEGTIEAGQHTVTIGPDAKMTGNIRGRQIIVAGTVLGDLFAQEQVSLRSTAKLTGNIATTRISIEDGGYFKGRVDASQSLGSNVKERQGELAAMQHA